MFHNHKFSEQQIKKYYNSAVRDFKIARQTETPEIIFKFCYDSLIKIAIAICAKNNLRVKSRAGHHIELLKTAAKFLNNQDIFDIGNEMRKKRNFDLYAGGIIITEKRAGEYRDWLKKIHIMAENYLNKNLSLF